VGACVSVRHRRRTPGELGQRARLDAPSGRSALVVPHLHEQLDAVTVVVHTRSRFGATVPRWFKVCDQAVDDQRRHADIDPTTRPDSYGSHTEPESPPMMPAATPTRRKYWLRITTYIPMTMEQRADDGVGGELAAHCAAVEVVGKLSVEAERPYGVEHPHDPREDQHYRREPKPSRKALQP